MSDKQWAQEDQGAQAAQAAQGPQESPGGSGAYRLLEPLHNSSSGAFTPLEHHPEFDFWKPTASSQAPEIGGSGGSQLNSLFSNLYLDIVITYERPDWPHVNTDA